VAFLTISKMDCMALMQIDHGTVEYQRMVHLRNEILRKPLGLTLTPQDLEMEKKDILIAAFDDDEILGCCVLSPVDHNTLRLRQMAVQGNLQGKGIGASIMSFAENLARDKGYKKLYMHARNNAVGFYEKFGYKINGKEFQEINIPHHIMEKKIF
jgi:N-acetylglutamate synthase-like GNAT family acetyltransferase